MGITLCQTFVSMNAGKGDKVVIYFIYKPINYKTLNYFKFINVLASRRGRRGKCAGTVQSARRRPRALDCGRTRDPRRINI